MRRSHIPGAPFRYLLQWGKSWNSIRAGDLVVVRSEICEWWLSTNQHIHPGIGPYLVTNITCLHAAHPNTLHFLSSGGVGKIYDDGQFLIKLSELAQVCTKLEKHRNIGYI